jgi:hypothetical protein
MIEKGEGHEGRGESGAVRQRVLGGPAFSTCRSRPQSWRPLISGRTKLARALLTMNDYIHEDPGRQETLANIAAFATAKMGQGELAKTLATLHQPAQSDQPGANGSAPADP